MNYKKLIFFIAIIYTTGCSESSYEPNDPSFIEMFNSFYETFDRYYSYFDYKNINWEEEKTSWGYAVINEKPYFAFEKWNKDLLNVSDFDAELEKFKGSDTIVIDVRMNPGGSDNLALEIAGRFTTQTLTVTYYKFRDGRQHNDFTELVERKLSPRGTWQFTNPVYVLIGRGCFSSNETFISAMREIPHVTLVGDTTGGSSGNPKFFNLGNGWEYAVPRWINYTADMQVIEWNGIAPDIYIETTEEDFLDGRDPVLDFVFNQSK